MARAVLPLKPQTGISVFQHHSYPLAILLNDEQLIPWFYEQYLQIFARQQRFAGPYHWQWQALTADQSEAKPDTLWVDFIEGERAYSNVLLEVPFTVDLVQCQSDYLQFLKDAIDDSYYVVAHLDESQLAPKKNYQTKIPHVYPNLIYGYDDDRQEFYSLGFDARWNFTQHPFTYDDVARAYQNGLQVLTEKPIFTAPDHNGWVRFLKPRQFTGTYPFDNGRFLQKLNSYIQGIGDSAENYFVSGWSFSLHNDDWQTATQEMFTFGSHVNTFCVHMLERLINGENVRVEYVSFHLLAEHKQLLLARLQYIANRNQLQSQLSPMLTQFEAVVASFQRLRLQFLRYQKSENPKVLQQMVQSLLFAAQTEKQLLETIYRLLLQLLR